MRCSNPECGDPATHVSTFAGVSLPVCGPCADWDRSMGYHRVRVLLPEDREEEGEIV